MTGLGDRPTPELILLLFTLVLALAIVLTGCGLFALALAHPEFDLVSAFTAFGQTLSLLSGTVLGYLVGRGGRGNGQATG